jgi:hypothetical protein
MPFGDAWRLSIMGVLPLVSLACEPTIVLGERLGSDAGDDAPFDGSLGSGGGDAAGAPDAALDSLSDAQQPVVIWSADHETGNLDQWTVGGELFGGYYQWGDSALETSTTVSHSASHAVRCFIDTSDGTSHGARLYRRIEEFGAYYSVWFRVEALHSVPDWWSIFLFHARDSPEPSADANFLWDLRVVQPNEGQLAIVLYEHATATTTQASAHSLPVQGWFHLEAYFEYAPPDGSRLGVWLDGERLLDAGELHGEDSRPVYWVIGNGSNNLDPAASTLFVDDAAIATARLGPER